MPPSPPPSASNVPPEPEHQVAAPLTTRKVKHPGKSFSSRNPTPIGAIGLVVLLAMLWAAFNASSLPLIGGGTTYHAIFSESANLKKGDDVRIAGVKVGTVDSVALQNNSVKVDFTVKNAFVGDQSTADIKIKTVLGAKMLVINSIGTKSMKGGTTIPEKDTTTPYDVYPAFTALTHTIQQIDTTKVAQAFETLASAFSGTPSSVHGLVTGLSRLSNTIASRDEALGTLLQNAQTVTETLANRDQDLQTLLDQGALLLDELTARRDAIHSLLVNTQVLSTQLRGLVSDNQKTIGPLLDQLDRIFALLVANQQNLDRGLALAGPFLRVFNNVVGNGRWFDNYIQNLNISGILSQIAGH
jgi:phospholipid/cholesterol/gamma-HCH transport system substrate-binding protein